MCVCVGGGVSWGQGWGRKENRAQDFFLAWAGKSPEPKPWQRQQVVIKAFHSAVVLEEEERRVQNLVHGITHIHAKRQLLP